MIKYTTRQQTRWKQHNKTN